MRPPDDDAVRASDTYCFEACVAALLEIDPGEVPDVHEVAERLKREGEEVIGWWRPFLRWLWSQGYKLHERLFVEHGPPDGWSIAVGPSPRDTDTTHAVVAKDGELAWDPYLDDPVGLPEGVGRYWVLEPL